MTDLVERTLSTWRRGGHVWGRSDCLLSIGDYLFEAGYTDVARRFWGTYDSEAGAQSILDAHGGAEGLIDMTGVPRASDAPQRGDVGLVQGIGSLCTGDGWALRLERGVVEVQARFVTPTAVWRV